MGLSKLIILLSLVGYVLTRECMQSSLIKQNIISSSERFSDLGNFALNVSLSLHITSLSIVPYTNHLEIEATVIREWQIPELFHGQTPCNDLTSITRLKNQITAPQIGFANAIHVSVSSHSTRIQVKKDGTLIHHERFKQSIPCTVKATSYPFGNTTCILSWRMDDNLGSGSEYHWKEIKINGNEAGDLLLGSFESSEEDEGLSVVFQFYRGPQKMLFLFYLPSTLFMFITWLSLFLGPMAITRTIMNMTSLILLMFLYLSNMAGIPDSSSFSAIDLWKIFSFIFVVLIMTELVVVTLMASLGRSRKCSRNKSGKYEMEPLYEEMNDLRNRKTRRTCGVCRISALIVDLITVAVMLAIFVGFSICYYYEKEVLVEHVNKFKLEMLKFF